MPNRKTRLLCALGGVLFTAGALATDIYVYTRADGSRLITDHARLEPGYRLIKVYAAADGAGDLAAPAAGRWTPSPSAFDDLIQQVSNRVSLDPALIKSVMHAESAFDPHAVSRKGAKGLMQLMPGTAQRYGVTRILDPHQNVLAGSRYLRDLLEQFDGNMRLALAGYNAGENAVVKYGGVPPYAETRHYVSKVIDLYKGYRNLGCENAPSGVTVISCSNPAEQETTSWITVVQ